jgi:hypothetical protein
MTPNDRLRIDIAAARYLEAVERDDIDTIAAIWTAAAVDPELEAALNGIHAGLIDEQDAADLTAASAAVKSAVEVYFPSATVVRPTAAAIIVADVAAELFRHPPDRLPAAAHQLNDRLRNAREPLPADLALSKFTVWAESKFGPAPEEYWKVFRQAALRLELRRSAEAEYHLAARSAPKPKELP